MNEIIKKNAIKFGLISGIFAITATLLMYLIDYHLFTNMWIGFSMLFIYIGIGVFQLINLRKDLGGYMSFKDGFTGYFLGALIGILMSSLFTILLFNVIDTETRDLVTQALVEFQVENLQKYNVPTEKIKEVVTQMEETPQFSTMGVVKSFGGSLIGSIIFGLILAAIFKRKPQELI
ncbi:DUF4199 domain-containing protein [Flavobacterium haoranii]|uniref:DUF4199 domain-containing protein n=1 Tax=Flavobacterium haoranii TaxID=683124 RepID=A0A1M6BHJ6_9FLAO|nr:DUF4199 domain-containing protein [Flavobacterium haoranii]SHI47943.1 Protein of unknown function [Flavobacterium haoranii]